MVPLKFKSELEYYAALMQFDGLNAEHVQAIQRIIDSLMNEGVFYDEFLEIVHPTSNLTEDFMPAFKESLKNLNCHIPEDREQALWLILKRYISHIVNGEIDPLEGVKQIIEDVYWSYDFDSKTKEFVGDSHSIEHLIGLYWGYEDMIEEPDDVSYKDQYGEAGIVELKKDILILAKQWLEKYG